MHKVSIAVKKSQEQQPVKLEWPEEVSAGCLVQETSAVTDGTMIVAG